MQVLKPTATSPVHKLDVPGTCPIKWQCHLIGRSLVFGGCAFPPVSWRRLG